MNLLIAPTMVALSMIACSNGYCKRIAGPHRTIKATLNDIYDALTDFKNDCGRFPTTTEGLQSLLVKPAGSNCKELSHWKGNPRWLGNPADDPWRQVLQYESDGKTYKVQASNGYFLTDKSPKQVYSEHWENPNPTLTDPPIQKLPGMAD